MACVPGFGCGNPRPGMFGGIRSGSFVRVRFVGPTCKLPPCPPAPCDIDFTPPTIVNQSPAGGSINNGNNIVLTFSEPTVGIQTGPASCNFVVSRLSNGSRVAGSVTLNGDGTVATFTPSENYSGGVDTIIVTVGVLSSSVCPGVFDACHNRMQPTVINYSIINID